MPGAARRRLTGLAADPLRTHGAAALCVLAAFALRLAIDPVVAGAVPFAAFYPAVMAAALLGGTAAGATATGLSLALAWYAFVPVRWSFAVERPGDVAGLALFVATAALMAFAGGAMRRLLRRLERSEAGLAASEARTQRTLAAMGVGEWSWDPATGEVSWSPGLYALLGLDPKAARPTAQAFADMIHPDDRPALQAALDAAVSGASARLHLDFRVLRADGEARWLASRAEVERGPDGRARRLVGVNFDVTETKAVEAALRESEARFRAVAESIPQLVWSTLPDGRCDYLSRQWIEFTGVPAERQHGFGWLDALHPDDREHARARWVAAVRGGAAYDVEYRLRRRDGRYFWFKTRGVPLAGEDGRVARWFGTSTDIAEIVEAREALARANEELERRVGERTRELDRIWQLSPDPICVLGLDGYFKALSPAWERVLGMPPRRMLAVPMLDMVHPDDRARTAEELERLAGGGVGVGVGFETRFLHADGGYRWLEWSGAAEGDRIYAAAKDVSGRKAAEAALIEANRRLAEEIAEREAAQERLVQAQKMEAVGQLTGGVAHDFNNLLQVVLSGLQMLRRSPRPEMRERIEQGLREAVARGQSLTRQLLAFSRRQALAPEPIDLRRRVAGLSELLGRSLRGDVALRIDLPPDLWTLRADPSQLELALLNLAVNARDAMPGGGELRIEARNATLDGRDETGLVGDFVRVEVHDQGTGVPPEVIDRVFEPFFTTKEPGKGTGLGLSQVYGFARQSGGTAAIRNRPGEGASVFLYLPRSAEPEGPEPEAAPQHAPGPAAGRGERVLLVEDDDGVAAVTEAMLADLGYEPVRVASGVEALRALEGGEGGGREGFRLVFSDVVMPGGVSGIDLARHVAERHPGLPLLLTTGYRDAMARPPEGVRILQKPYAREDLEVALAELLPTAPVI
jgi:PAS domain S-box-containing protein